MILNVYSYLKVWVRDKVEVDADTEAEAIRKYLDDIDYNFEDTEVLWSGFDDLVSKQENNGEPTFYIKNSNDEIIYTE